MKWVISVRTTGASKTGFRRMTIEADSFYFDNDSEAYVFFSRLEDDTRVTKKSVCVIPRTEVLSIVEEAQA